MAIKMSTAAFAEVKIRPLAVSAFVYRMTMDSTNK